jgi:hypothetical protein
MSTPTDTTAGLSALEIAVLAFEHRRFRDVGTKEGVIYDEFGFSATRYYQVLNALIDDPAATAADPILVARLRRLREIRRFRRSASLLQGATTR